MSAAFPKRACRDTHEVDANGELIVLDADGATLVVLNPVGAAVYELADGTRSLEAIATIVAETCGIPRERATRDVLAFAEELVQARILTFESAP